MSLHHFVTYVLDCGLSDEDFYGLLIAAGLATNDTTNDKLIIRHNQWGTFIDNYAYQMSSRRLSQPSLIFNHCTMGHYPTVKSAKNTTRSGWETKLRVIPIIYMVSWTQRRGYYSCRILQIFVQFSELSAVWLVEQ